MIWELIRGLPFWVGWRIEAAAIRWMDLRVSPNVRDAMVGR